MFLFFNIFPLIVVFINNVMKEEVIFLLVFYVPQKCLTPFATEESFLALIIEFQ